MLTVGLGAYYLNQFLWAEDRSALLIGDTSHGHFQIELACSSCHTDAFGGPEVLQNACVNCHGAELELANDAHPKSKFTNPRNADRIEILDARYCVTCHTEHKREVTLEMGVTLPADYCYHCHQDVFETRPSHEGMGFNTCASGGCHNFHDNRALYEDFLVEHSGQPDLLAAAVLPALQKIVDEGLMPLTKVRADAPENKLNPQAINEWASSSHAENSVNCSGCHQPKNTQWVDRPGLAECQSCHEFQAEGFVSGKHGMRLNPSLNASFSGVKPEQSERLAFKAESHNREHGCNNCHSSHSYDTKFAAVEACLTCHDDKHSVEFLDSPHAALWQAELTGQGPNNSGVSCANCHMPRQEQLKNGLQQVVVQHNQNANLRPNEKMLREVCMNCHGLGFSINSLADGALIENNFNGRPSVHVPSIDMAVERNTRLNEQAPNE